MSNCIKISKSNCEPSPIVTTCRILLEVLVMGIALNRREFWGDEETYFTIIRASIDFNKDSKIIYKPTTT